MPTTMCIFLDAPYYMSLSLLQLYVAAELSLSHTILMFYPGAIQWIRVGEVKTFCLCCVQISTRSNLY